MHTSVGRHLFIALVSCLSWLPGTHAAHAQATRSRSADTTWVVLRIRVVDRLSSSPLEAVRVDAFSDSSAAAVSFGRTSADGMVELRVPRDSVELRVRRIGFDAKRATIDAATRAAHAVAHEFQLERAGVSAYPPPASPEIGRRLQPIGGRSIDPVRATLRIRVLDHLSGAALEAAWVGAYDGNGPWPIAQGRTAADGVAELDVPPADVDVLVTKGGFDEQRRTIDAGASSAAAHVFRLVRAVTPSRHLADSIRAELGRPTEVTPCRPFTGGASRIWDRLRTAVLLDVFAQQGMPDLRLASVAHVVDRARCHAAIAAIGRHYGSPRDGMQVHLFRLDYAGWAAIDPSPLGDVTIIHVLDWNLTRVRRVFGIRGR